MAPKTKKTTPKSTHKAKHESLKRRLEQRRIRISNPHHTTGYRGFLALPAEIKNAIYDSWAADQHTIFLRPSGPDFPTSTHPIAQLCRQTRDEFLSIMTQNASFAAKMVIASVHDFNFYYPSNSSTLSPPTPGLTSDTSRTGNTLTLTESFVREPPVNNLVHWMRWLESFEFAYGLGIEYEFRQVAEPEAALGIFRQFSRAHKDKGPLGEVADRLREFVEWMREAGNEEAVVEDAGGKAVRAGETEDEASDAELENELTELMEENEREVEDDREIEVESAYESAYESESDVDEGETEEDDDPEDNDDPERPRKLVYDRLTPEVNEEEGWADADEDW